MKSGSGAGMRTGTMGKKGFPGAGGGVHARPKLSTYREGVIGKPATGNKTPAGTPKGDGHGRKAST